MISKIYGNIHIIISEQSPTDFSQKIVIAMALCHITNAFLICSTAKMTPYIFVKIIHGANNSSGQIVHIHGLLLSLI